MDAMVTDRMAHPEFAVVVRGYDRAQVDDYLSELLAWMSEAERRILATDEANEALRREVVQLRDAAAALEQRAGVPGPQSLSAFSERMGQLMQSAVAAADELRSEAEREANERRDAVAAEVERMVERAKAEAREILRRARTKERDLEENLAALVARRSEAVEDLGRLHRQLSELIAMPEAASVADGVPAAAEPRSPGRGDQGGGPGVGTAGEPKGAAHATEIGARPGGPDATQAMPAVQPGAGSGSQPDTPAPEPTMVRYPSDDPARRRGPR